MNGLRNLSESVFARQKVLADIYKSSGQKSLFDYVGSWPVLPLSPQSEVVAEALGSLLNRVYSKDVSSAVIEQFKAQPLVSTIDHHGILNHPFFINSNLIFSLRPNVKYLICLSTSGVSLNNSSWPGCLLLSGKGGALQRFSFFSDKVKIMPVFSAPALKKNQIGKVIQEVLGDRFLSEPQKAKLSSLIGDSFNKEDIYSLKNFSDQASLLSTRLWKKIFPDAPEVVYIPVEELVEKLLREEVIPNSNHVLHRLMFFPEGWRLVEKYFTGSLGAFSSSHKGSFLFWGIDSKGRRTHLHRRENILQDGSWKVGLKPELIEAALAKRQIYPTSLVCFLVLLYYQVTCLGGFNQVNWLTEIKNKFTSLLQEFGESSLAKAISEVPTQNFAEGNLAFLQQKQILIKATGIDIYLNEADIYKNYHNLGQLITVAQSMESLLPEIYRVIIPANLRDRELLSWTDEEIIKQNGAADQIKKSLV